MAPPNRRMDVLDLLPDDASDSDRKKGSVEYLEKHLGLQGAAIRRYLRQLRDLGLAHIGRWNRTKGLPAAVWVKGAGLDEPMVGPKTNAYYCRKHRKSVRKAVERARQGLRHDDRYNNHVAVALANDTAERSRVSPQHWFSALGL